MYRLEYAPRAMDDLERAKEYIIRQHGANVARKSLQRLTSSARRLEKFPEEGLTLMNQKKSTEDNFSGFST